MVRLGVNIDHVATIRNARGGTHPDPLRAAHLVERAGADSVTLHLREDRRHILDDDVRAIHAETKIPLNLEMAASRDMVELACRLRPPRVCLVPERRAERTTEGGLDARDEALGAAVARLRAAGCQVSLFIEPREEQVVAAAARGADAIELHTGHYANCEDDSSRAAALEALSIAAQRAVRVNLSCHAGHGLNFDNVGAVARMPQIEELNIGHYLIGEAVFCGLEDAIGRMRALIDQARP